MSLGQKRSSLQELSGSGKLDKKQGYVCHGDSGDLWEEGCVANSCHCFLDWASGMLRMSVTQEKGEHSIRGLGFGSFSCFKQNSFVSI